MPDNLPQQVDVQLPPETSSVVVAKVVYGLHALSIIIGVVTGGSILGAFLFGLALDRGGDSQLRDALRRQGHLRGKSLLVADSHVLVRLRLCLLVGFVGFILSLHLRGAWPSGSSAFSS